MQLQSGHATDVSTRSPEGSFAQYIRGRKTFINEAQWTTSETINAMAIIAIIQFNAVTSPNQRILAKSTSKTNQSSG